MRHVLLATDGSEASERATHVAAEVAKSLSAELTIFSVAGTMELSRREIREIERAEGNAADALDEQATQILARAASIARKSGVPTVHTDAGWGDPAAQIIDAASRLKADSIVMGRRGHGRLAGLLMGSVSQKVASLAPCVVVLVP